jgi:hypothetical protein
LRDHAVRREREDVEPVILRAGRHEGVDESSHVRILDGAAQVGLGAHEQHGELGRKLVGYGRMLCKRTPPRRERRKCCGARGIEDEEDRVCAAKESRGERGEAFLAGCILGAWIRDAGCARGGRAALTQIWSEISSSGL